MNTRNVRQSDYDRIIQVLNNWWGGRKMNHMLPRLFFEHFRETSFVTKKDNEIIGFLIGFFSQSNLNEAYIHFAGIHPNYRKQGIASTLYNIFFETARRNNRHTIKCVTSTVNKQSIAFHLRLGFQPKSSPEQEDDIPYSPDYDGEGEHRVIFTKKLAKSD